MGYLESINDAEIGLKVNDNFYENGVIEEILKTRIKVKFESRDDLVTYDIPHLKICLTKL